MYREINLCREIGWKDRKRQTEWKIKEESQRNRKKKRQNKKEREMEWKIEKEIAREREREREIRRGRECEFVL